MRVFAISDLHLSGRQDKAMDVFGEKWINHFEKIKKLGIVASLEASNYVS